MPNAVRHEADYGEFAAPEVEKVADSIADAERFVAQMKRLLREART